MDMTAKSRLTLKDTEDLSPAEANAATSASAVVDHIMEMARKKGVIVFRALTLDDAEISRVKEVRAKMGPGEPLIAITGPNTSLSDARKLTRVGVTEVVPDTIATDEFEELLAELTQEQAPFTSQMQRGSLVAVTRSRGGVGATTVAVNLADALLESRGRFKKSNGKKVALVDFDVQLGDVASFLDVEPSEALYELAITGKSPDETFLRQAMTTLPSGLSVLTAPSRFAPLDALKVDQVAQIIDILRRTHDYVVLDLPCGLSQWMDPIIEQADRALMVTDCAVPSIRQARRLMDFFAETNPSLQVEVVVNHEAKPMMLRRHQAAAEKVLDRKFNHWVPDDPPTAREALDRGVPLSQTSPRSRMAKAINRLSRDLIATMHQNETATEFAAQ